MYMKTLITIAALAATPAIADDLHNITEPTESKGITIEPLQKSDLVEQLPEFKGYDFRARRLTFAAGASFPKHNHAVRPGFVYVESGEIIESRNGVTRKFKAGDTWIETADTEHWIRNISDKDTVIIAVDLPKQK